MQIFYEKILDITGIKSITSSGRALYDCGYLLCSWQLTPRADLSEGWGGGELAYKLHGGYGTCDPLANGE